MVKSLGIRGMMILSNGALFAIIGVILGVILWTTNQQESNATTINLAGRQRMLAQQMTKELLLYVETGAENYLTSLNASAWVFDATLKALQSGGQAPAQVTRDHPPMATVGHPSPMVQAQLQKVAEIWQPLYQPMNALFQARDKYQPEDRQHLRQALVAQNQALVASMNQAVVSMTDEAKILVDRIIRTALIGLVAGMATLGWIVWQILALNRQLGRFMGEMDILAAGNLTQSLTVRRNANEVDRIAHAVNRMTKSVSEIIRVLFLQSNTLGACVEELTEARSSLSRDSQEGAGLVHEIVRDQDRIRHDITIIREATAATLAEMEAMGTASVELSANVQHIASASGQMSANVATTATAAIQINSNIAGVMGNLDSVNQSVQRVADAIQEMNLAQGEVRQRSQQAKQRSGEAAHNAQGTIHEMAKLTKSAQEIGDVVEIINSIAEQTNMLALNAAIEAAGAGSAGKGFAVVANEVKELARQTSEATRMISEKIGEIQTNTGTTSASVREILAIIGVIDQTNSEISHSVDEQTTTSADIANSMGKLSIAIDDVSRNVQELNMAANEVATIADHSAVGTGEIARSTTELAMAAEDLAKRSRAIQGSTREIMQAVAEANTVIDHALDRVNTTSRAITFIEGSTHHASLLIQVVHGSSKQLLEAGSRLRITPEPFQIADIKLAHLNLLGRLENVIRGRLVMSSAEVTNGHQCAFGKWYDTEGIKQYGEQPAFRQLGEVHMRVHEVAREVVVMANNNQMAAALQRMDLFEQLREDLFQRLDGLYLDNYV